MAVSNKERNLNRKSYPKALCSRQFDELFVDCWHGFYAQMTDFSQINILQRNKFHNFIFLFDNLNSCKFFLEVLHWRNFVKAQDFCSSPEQDYIYKNHCTIVLTIHCIARPKFFYSLKAFRYHNCCATLHPLADVTSSTLLTDCDNELVISESFTGQVMKLTTFRSP